jgi:predicted DCC family thiol-disulfide oxidoreductase YuxK
MNQIADLMSNLETDQISQINNPIVFFDGECVMCSRFVNLMFKIDKKGLIYIAPLQGETAKKLLPPLPNNPEEWSIFYLDNGKIYQQSDAVIHICDRLGGIWYLVSLIRIIPSQIRNFIYRIIARNRYQILGQCHLYSLINNQEKMRFLP